jgi:predicted permease
LLLRSFWRLQNIPLGMNADSVVTAKIDLPSYRYPQAAQQIAFFRDLQSRLAQMPGAGALAVSDTLPPSGGMQATFLSAIEIAGKPKFTEGTGGMVGYRYVTPGYFSVLGIRIERGRTFEERELSSTDWPVVISAALAKRFFDDEDPIGKAFRFAHRNAWGTIVGVAADVKNDGLVSVGGPEFYLPWKEESDGYYRSAHLIARTALPPATIGKWIRAEAASIDPTIPVTVEAMSLRVSRLADRPRFNATLLTLFAAMGVMLAAIGIYGVVAFLVSQQTREIGVRMALGAQRGSVYQMVMRQAGRLTLIGVGLGLVCAVGASMLMRKVLFSVAAWDVSTLAGVAAVLGLAALLASFLPARRAASVNPCDALRAE